MSTLSKYNQTTSPISALSTFTGVGENTEKYQGVQVAFYGDQQSTLHLEWSTDNVNYRYTLQEDVAANTAFCKFYHNRALYFRLRISNTAHTNMTVTEAQTRYVDDVPDQVASMQMVLATDTTVSAGTSLAVVDVSDMKTVCVFGHTNGDLTLTTEYSNDKSLWVAGSEQVECIGDTDFHMEFSTAAKYIRFVPSTSVTLTLHVGAKQ